MNPQQISKISFSLAEIAQKSILYEAILTPKPGLVDAVDSGSHKDMDIYTFIDSSSNLYKGFYLYAKNGISCDDNEQILFKNIRKIGIDIEKEMFNSTNNINTHKGINFSFGIVLAATGFYFKKNTNLKIGTLNKGDTSNILNICKNMTLDLIQNDFKNIPQNSYLTYGEKLYLKTGFTGIRGEVQNGFPTIEFIALPEIRKISSSTLKKENILHHILFKIMSVTDDSNIIKRGGFANLDFVKNISNKFLQNGGVYNNNYKEKIYEINKIFKEKNISSGGSADLLAICIYFAFLEGIF